jgi:hypothetical protein
LSRRNTSVVAELDEGTDLLEEVRIMTDTGVYLLGLDRPAVAHLI